MIAAAFNANLGSFVIADVFDSDNDAIQALDSHNDHYKRHREGLTSVFTKFVELVNVLKTTKAERANGEKSLFDLTTIVLITDFSRTAASNSSRDGTDHNPYNNSCLLAGKGIAGGRQIGASTVFSKKIFNDGQSRLQALPYDFALKRPLTPEEFLQLTANQGQTLACGRNSCIDFIRPGDIFKTLAYKYGISDSNLGELKHFRFIPGLVTRN